MSKPAAQPHAHVILINRAPVLTLWGAVVAERLGFRWDEALTLGKALAGLNAHTKGVSLGLFEPAPEAVKEQRRAKEGERLHVDLMHRAIPVTVTKVGLRALCDERAVSPASVERYLEGKFGEDLAAARDAMRTLARSLPPRALAKSAYGLYERFRPEIPAGVRGWGAKGSLSVDAIALLTATKARQIHA
jgi:hypothetical protein